MSFKSHEDVESVEKSVFGCVTALGEVLSEEELRPFFGRLFSWAEEGLQPGALLQAKLRLPTIFHLANEFDILFYH